MRGIRTCIRYVRDAVKSVIRNFSLSLASVSCITITLIVVAFSLILSYNVENFAETIRKDVTMVVFIAPDTADGDFARIESSIRAVGNIDKMTFKTKQEAAEEASKWGSDMEAIFGEISEEDNPLMASFEIKVKDLDKISQTADKIAKIDQVSRVDYGKKTVEQLIVIFDVIRKVSIGAVLALVLVTAFLIANTIKLAIYSRRREIEIMRLVGASNISIKIPFVIEGLFLGILGSIIPMIITVWGYVSLYKFFDGKLMGINFITLIEPTPFVYLISLLLMVIGVLVGMFGSWRAVKKYLKI